MSEESTELQKQLERALESSRYMVAIWRLEDGQLKMYRLTENFPKSDFDVAIDMLNNDLSTKENSSIDAAE